jgi:hypothetical protein
MKAIRIDDPCHEDWNKMNPTQQGAFCGKCEIDVIDFSRLSMPEVKSVLKDNAGKHLCGRFENKQLAELNNDFAAWQQNQPKAFQSRFVYALLLVFGLTLFSCSEEDGKQLAQLSSIEMQAALAEPENKIVNELFFHMDAVIANEMIRFMPHYEMALTHGMVMNHDVLEEVEYAVTENHTLGQMVAGGMSYDHVYMNYLDATADSTESTLPTEIVTIYNPFETNVYPNPTADFSNLSIYVHEPAQFTIEMYSMTGQKVAEIYNGELQEGRHQFEIEMLEYPTGTYLVKVWSDKQDETLKILKIE